METVGPWIILWVTERRGFTRPALTSSELRNEWISWFAPITLMDHSWTIHLESESFLFIPIKMWNLSQTLEIPACDFKFNMLSESTFYFSLDLVLFSRYWQSCWKDFWIIRSAGVWSWTRPEISAAWIQSVEIHIIDNSKWLRKIGQFKLLLCLCYHMRATSIILGAPGLIMLLIRFGLISDFIICQRGWRLAGFVQTAAFWAHSANMAVQYETLLAATLGELVQFAEKSLSR